MEEIREFLEEKTALYNQPEFIANDPIQVPHLFNDQKDIEIAAFLTATISWGRRESIINNATRLLEMLGESPYDFVMQANEAHLDVVNGFCHRTFNDVDARYFLKGLKLIYKQGGMQTLFENTPTMKEGIMTMRNVFFSAPHQKRTRKHFSDPSSNSASKRLNMFLRWMVRKDKNGVDFGLWKDVRASKLMLPLDVHTSTVARKLGLLKRKQNDWKAVEEVTANLRLLDKNDPVKYDFALFGLGAVEGFA